MKSFTRLSLLLLGACVAVGLWWPFMVFESQEPEPLLPVETFTLQSYVETEQGRSRFDLLRPDVLFFATDIGASFVPLENSVLDEARSMESVFLPFQLDPMPSAFEFRHVHVPGVSVLPLWNGYLGEWSLRSMSTEPGVIVEGTIVGEVDMPARAVIEIRDLASGLHVVDVPVDLGRTELPFRRLALLMQVHGGGIEWLTIGSASSSVLELEGWIESLLGQETLEDGFYRCEWIPL